MTQDIYIYIYTVYKYPVSHTNLGRHDVRVRTHQSKCAANVAQVITNERYCDIKDLLFLNGSQTYCYYRVERTCS